MSPESFFRLVERMRSRQKEYFRTRSSSALAESRRLEWDIDAEIERVNRLLAERRNLKLNFNEKNNESISKIL